LKGAALGKNGPGRPKKGQERILDWYKAAVNKILIFSKQFLKVFTCKQLG
jgi:hypothetical protein